MLWGGGWGMWVGRLRRGGWQERLRREERLCSGGGKVCIYTVLGCGAGLELRYDTLSRILFYSFAFRSLPICSCHISSLHHPSIQTHHVHPSPPSPPPPPLIKNTQDSNIHKSAANQLRLNGQDHIPNIPKRQEKRVFRLSLATRVV